MHVITQLIFDSEKKNAKQNYQIEFEMEMERSTTKSTTTRYGISNGITRNCDVYSSIKGMSPTECCSQIKWCKLPKISLTAKQKKNNCLSNSLHR